MNVTYTLRSGDVWEFAYVPAKHLAFVVEALDPNFGHRPPARRTSQGFIDVATHGVCQRSANDSDLIPIGDIARIEIEVTS